MKKLPSLWCSFLWCPFLKFGTFLASPSPDEVSLPWEIFGFILENEGKNHFVYQPPEEETTFFHTPFSFPFYSTNGGGSAVFTLQVCKFLMWADQSLNFI